MELLKEPKMLPFGSAVCVVCNNDVDCLPYGSSGTILECRTSHGVF